MNVLSLFSGIGGLDLGIKIAVPEARVVCYVERDPYCRRVLMARMADGSLDPGPVWEDVTTFDGLPWQGLVDCVSGGFPCQDISNAGKREGIGGERSGLWSEFARLVGEIRPGYVFLENVAALSIRGLGQLLGDLFDLGYDARWETVSACAVGAPHMRQRLFLLAHAAGSDGRVLLEEVCRWPAQVKTRRGDRLPMDTVGEEAGSWATDQPEVCRVADGSAKRVDCLRSLGNAVVPLQAAAAFTLLARRMS